MTDDLCACGCGRALPPLHGRRKYATRMCRDKRDRELKERRAAVTMEHEMYRFVLANDPCSYCGQRGEPYRPTTGVDHIVPVSQDGEMDWTNITACCKDCNSSKQDRPLLEFLLIYAPLRWSEAAR